MINKNEVLYQQVLRTCKDRDEGGQGLHESELVGGEGPPACEYSHGESRSRSGGSHEQSRISLQRSSQNSQSNLQMNEERERSHYLDRTLHRNDAALWHQSDEPAKGAAQQDGADGDGWNGQGDSSQVLYGPVPASASAAPSDSASQCNYRTREEVPINGQRSSQASGTISCGGGPAATQGTATAPAPLTIANTHNPTLKSQHQRGESTSSANHQPHDGQAFDYAGAR